LIVLVLLIIIFTAVIFFVFIVQELLFKLLDFVVLNIAAGVDNI